MNKYSRLEPAQARMIKLMKDGVTGLSIQSKGGYHTVLGAPDVLVPVSTFGRLMEAEAVQDAALDIDEKAINPYDVGETHARTARELAGRGRLHALTLGSCDAGVKLAFAAALMMTQSELRQAEQGD